MFSIKSAKFLLSAAKFEQCLVSGDICEIAVVGKSNVGKSSFINFLTGQSKLARTSKSPGRTRLINYFLLNEGLPFEFLLTDLPGYGYAEVSFAEKQKWAELLETYLTGDNRPDHILFLVDIRHEPSDGDKAMFNFLFAYNLPFTVIATKSDKIAKSKVKNRIREIASVLKVGEANLIAVSAQAKIGKEEVFSRLGQILQN